MHVLFVEPSFPSYQQQLLRGLAEVGARVTGIGEARPEQLPGEVARHLHGYEHVRSVVDEEALYEAVRRCQQREWVDRLEATIEAHVLPAARVREACGIPGTSVHTAFLCRDKPAMKEALREVGVPCAASAGVDDPEAARAFAREVGFPLIAKPRSAAGAAGTWRLDSPAELEMAIRENGLGHGGSIALEEFVEGHEGIYDTISIGGRVAHDFIGHYYPNVLDAMRNRWISPTMAVTNRMDAEAYQELRRMGQRVIEALGIGTSATHMEWFFGPKGLRFSEIGCRPTGQSAWDLYCAANEVDVYREWAMAVVHGDVDRPMSRRFAAGMISLRPDRDGRIAGYEGLDAVHRAFGEWVIDSHFPPPGSPTRPFDEGMLANAWMRLRHPDYDRLRAMLDAIGETARVRAG